MQVELDALKRIVRDGVGLNRDTLAACLPEMIAEIEKLRTENKEMSYRLESLCK